MSAKIPENHPLRKLLGTVVSNTFREYHDESVIHIDDLIQYVSDLLVDFTHASAFERIKDQHGRPVKTIKDLLTETECWGQSFSFDREQEVHKHIGDYTLFMLGLFPEYIKNLKTDNLIHHPDSFIDHTKCGKRSYNMLVEFSNATNGQQALLFTNLSHRFETNMLCLYEAKRRLDEMAVDPFMKSSQLIV